MLDLKFIRENAAQVKAACVKKRIKDEIDQILALDQEVRDLKRMSETLKAESNARSKEIPKLAGADKEKALAGLKDLSARVKEADEKQRAKEEEIKGFLLRVPNVPSPDVPDGKDESENVEIKKVGAPRTFEFAPKDHVDLGVSLDILDIERAARIAGSRTYFLKNEGVLLELAVLRLALDHMMAAGFSPMLPPHLVRTEAMLGTAYLPGGEEQAYQTKADETWLIGTSEVPLTAWRMDEILDDSELPLKLVGLSHCYRREAGTYGRDTRGLYRIHQFQKIEQVIVCRNDEALSRRFHEEILGHAEAVLGKLALPYRVVNVCGGDLGRPQVQKFDIETWMPSRKGYGETHSASRFHDFQARRLNLRYRDAAGKVQFCHTLNNTVIASPRILIPILENYQQADGSVIIPDALRKYMNGQSEIRPKKK